MAEEKLNTGQKALQINLDAKKYGTFAEIGAGQEVARWFFHVGKASGTVAKTISAYDMAISDAIYGPSDRYVSRKRLQSMLDHEYDLLLQRLAKPRGDKCTFFVFANTVATKRDEGSGWLPDLADMRAKVTPKLRTEKAPNGYFFTYIEFPAGTYNK